MAARRWFWAPCLAPFPTWTWLGRRFRPHPDYSATRLWLCIWLILFTHVLLDALTSYGTQLFWPLTSAPVAISSIFIIDPLYTLPLLLAVIVGLFAGMGSAGLRWQRTALVVSSVYLLSTLAGKQMARPSSASAPPRRSTPCSGGWSRWTATTITRA